MQAENMEPGAGGGVESQEVSYRGHSAKTARASILEVSIECARRECKGPWLASYRGELGQGSYGWVMSQIPVRMLKRQ